MRTVAVFLCLVQIIEAAGFIPPEMSANLALFEDPTDDVATEEGSEQVISKLRDELNEIKNSFRKYQKAQDSNTADVGDQLKMMKKKMRKFGERLSWHDSLLEGINQQLMPKKNITEELSTLYQHNTMLLDTLQDNSEEVKRQKSKLHSLETKTKSPLGDQEEFCKSVSSQLGYTYDRPADFCFKVHHELKTWDEANQVCQTEKGFLAQVDTDIRVDLVSSIIRDDDGSVDFYLGATDKEEDGVWRWVVDNSVMPHFDMTGHKSCLEVEWYSLKFDDSGCNNSEQKFICEMRTET